MSTPQANPLTLALSGGGAKCAAHAGVLAVLEDAGLPVGALAGTSGGGAVAVLHGLGMSPGDIRDFIAGASLLDMWDLDPTRRAILGWRKTRVYLRRVVGDKTFADLSIPVALMASDLVSGREVRLTSGRLDDALMATMAIPGLFAPVSMGGMSLVDGAVLNPLPVDVARDLGSRVVAVDVLEHRPSDEPIHLFESRGPLRYAAMLGRRLPLARILEVVNQATVLASNRLVEHKLESDPPDLLLQPRVGRIGLLAFDLARTAFDEGVAVTRAKLPELMSLAFPPARPPSQWMDRVRSFWRRVSTRRAMAPTSAVK